MYNLEDICFFSSSFFKTLDIFQLQFHFIDMTGTVKNQHLETHNLDFHLFYIKFCFGLYRKFFLFLVNYICNFTNR